MGDDGRSPHRGVWAGPGRGGVTCSCAGPSAGGASPGAGPGSSHHHLWGRGLAPEPPAAPGSVSLGTGYRSAPPPGWTGTVGGETRALVGRIWKTDPTRETSPPPAPSWGSGVLTGRPLCQTGQSSGEGPAGPGSAEMGSLWGNAPGPSWTQAPHRALAFHPLPLHPLHLPLPGQVLGLHHACKAQVLLCILVA